MPDEASTEGSESFPSSGDQPTNLVDISDTAMLETVELPAPATAAEPVPGTLAALQTAPLALSSSDSPSALSIGPGSVSIEAPPNPPPGGGEPPTAPPARSPSPAAQVPEQPPLYKYGEGVTRVLCSCVHLYQPMAKQICDTILGGPYNAAAPQWGVDLVALVRHARESMQRWDARDQKLRWVTLVGAALFLFTGAIRQLGAIPLWVAVLVWACIPVFVMVTSFGIVFGHYSGTRARAVAAVKDTKTPIRDLAGAAMSADDVASLEELATANVVTFDKSYPFATDGWLLENWTLSIDLERSRRLPQSGGEAGPPIEPVEVTASGVHRHLLQSLTRGPLTGLRVEQRLYVRGNAARKVKGLCDDWTHARVHPRPRIDPAIIDDFVDKPEVHARAYVAAQRAIWGGQMVVTVLVHVRRNGSILHIEGSEHAIPPLKARFAKVGDFPTGPWRVFRHTWEAAWRSTGHQVQQCWPRLYKARKAGRSWGKVCRKNERKHREGVVFNYGASDSLRFTWSDPGRMIYFALADEVMSTVPMRRSALREIAEYVESCGYDVTDLREQEKQIDMIGVTRLVEAAAKMKPMGSKKPA